jgi:hypothetical protein
MNGGQIYDCNVIAYAYEDLEGRPGGGGVNVRGGTFTMKGGKIERCFGRYYGGAVYVDRKGIFIMEGGLLYDNSAPYGGGVATFRGGVFDMKGGEINRNLAVYGGGVFVAHGSEDADSANPYDPRRPPNFQGMVAGREYRGVLATNGYNPAVHPITGLPRINDPRRREGFYFSRGDITQNQALHSGGGVFNAQGGITYMTMPVDATGTTRTRLHDNTAEGFGAGVYNLGLYIMMNGIISNNTGDYGGGVCADGGMFVMEQGDIVSNKASQFGGGMMVYEGQVAMHGGRIRNNDGGYYGGGLAFMPSVNAFAMSGGVISGNIATNGGSTLYFYPYNDPSVNGLAYYGTRSQFPNPYDTSITTWPGDPHIDTVCVEDSNGKGTRFQALLAPYAANASGVLLPQDRHVVGNVAGASTCIRMEVIDGDLWVGTGSNDNNKGIKQPLLIPGIIPGELY